LRPASHAHACNTEGFPRDSLCATYSVWENRETRQGRKIALHIVILPAAGTNPAPEPVFILAGGPGQAATSMIPLFARNTALRARHVLVFVDQRGAGRSNPLHCDFYRVAAGAFPIDAVRACRERLSRIADLARYTTAPAMDDLDDVRRWLGHKKITLWGASYGTTAAQVYLRRHPETVRAAVLIGVMPVDELLPLNVAATGQRVIDMIFARGAFPDLPGDLRRVMDRVRKGVDVEVNGVRVRPSPVHVAEGIRHSLYGDDGRTLPALIHRAAAGDFAPLLERTIAAEVNIEHGLAMGLNLSVTCAENVPYIDDVTLARETRNTFLGDLRVQEQRAACREWVRGPVPADVHELPRSDVPVLLLSGNLDPATPPSFAERVASRLPNSRHIMFPEASHGNLGACGTRIWTEFIESGEVRNLNTGCLAPH